MMRVEDGRRMRHTISGLDRKLIELNNVVKP